MEVCESNILGIDSQEMMNCLISKKCHTARYNIQCKSCTRWGKSFCEGRTVSKNQYSFICLIEAPNRVVMSIEENKS